MDSFSRSWPLPHLTLFGLIVVFRFKIWRGPGEGDLAQRSRGPERGGPYVSNPPTKVKAHFPFFSVFTAVALDNGLSRRSCVAPALRAIREAHDQHHFDGARVRTILLPREALGARGTENDRIATRRPRAAFLCSLALSEL